jgi:hypothetical protein
MEAQPSPTQQAISTASATLALIAGAISVLTAFAYIVAYKYLTAFFAALGCDWRLTSIRRLKLSKPQPQSLSL